MDVERDGAHMRHLDLGLGETSHGLLDKLEVVLDGIELLSDDAGHLLALDAGLGDVLIQELLASVGVGIKDLGDELLEIENLDTLITKNLAKVSCSSWATSRNGTSSKSRRSSSNGGRFSSSSPGLCRQTFLSCPISLGTCKPFVIASYLSYSGTARRSVLSPLRDSVHTYRYIQFSA